MSSQSEYTNLSPRLASIAKSVCTSNTTDDFSLSPKVVKLAYNQIVTQGGVGLGGSQTTIGQAIVKYITSGESNRNIGNDLASLNGYADFTWSLYDQCVALCKQHQLDVVEYIEPPVMPNTMQEALSWLKVSEIKPILKDKGQKVGGKRADLEARMLEHVGLSDIDSILKGKLSYKLAKYQQDSIALKYELLTRFIHHRVYFLNSLCRFNSHAIITYQPIIRFMGDNEQDDKKLAKLLITDGYDAVIQNGKVCQLMPLYPSSIASLDFAPVRSSQQINSQPIRQINQNNNRRISNHNLDRKRPAILLGIGLLLFVIFVNVF